MKCRLLEGLRMVDRADDLLPCRQEVTRRVQRMGEVFGDDSVAVAMIERLVHHAEILSLKGDSYRLKDRDLGAQASPNTRHHLTPGRTAAVGGSAAWLESHADNRSRSFAVSGQDFAHAEIEIRG
jgi:hypothetical protein